MSSRRGGRRGGRGGRWGDAGRDRRRTSAIRTSATPAATASPERTIGRVRPDGAALGDPAGIAGLSDREVAEPVDVRVHELAADRIGARDPRPRAGVVRVQHRVGEAAAGEQERIRQHHLPGPPQSVRRDRRSAGTSRRSAPRCRRSMRPREGARPRGGRAGSSRAARRCRRRAARSRRPRGRRRPGGPRSGRPPRPTRSSDRAGCSRCRGSAPGSAWRAAAAG